MDLKGIVRKLDGWANSLTGVGTTRDKRQYSVFNSTNWRVSQNQQTLESLFNSADLFRKIVKIYPEEMTREWVKLSIGDDDGAELADAVTNEARKLGLRKAVREALVWSRLYGGAMIVVGIDDGQKMSEQVNLDNIKRVTYLRVYDRWCMFVSERYGPADDVDEFKIGTPKVYTITLEDGRQKNVHESRMVRFDGAMTPTQQKRENDGWCNSVLEAPYETLRDFDVSMLGVANVMQDFSQGVYKIKGLANLLSADSGDLVRSRLMQLDRTRSMARAIPLDADGESFERLGANVGGMADLVDRLMMRVSGATGIPVTRLFGRSPAGQNATGEHDEANFAAEVRSEQTHEMIPRIEWILSLMMRSKDGPTNGVIPTSWSVEPNPLSQPSAKEQAETRKIDADADSVRIASGVVSAEEVRQSRWGGDCYGTEIVLMDDVNPVGEPSEVMDGYSKDAANKCRTCDWARGDQCLRSGVRIDAGFGCDAHERKILAVVKSDSMRGINA